MTPDNQVPLQYRKGAYDPRVKAYPFIVYGMIALAIAAIMWKVCS